VANEKLELGTLSFETAFKNVTPSGISWNNSNINQELVGESISGFSPDFFVALLPPKEVF